MHDRVMSVILGGGQGTRLSPLTYSRSKPAVPIAGKYRLVDIPISNCLNSDLRRIFVLTQFNSASLNRHIKNTYHFDSFSNGFVDVLAAEQTPDSSNWYQGTADAVRQCMHHLDNFEYDYVLILSGDQLYQMDFVDMIRQHILTEADISIATTPVKDREAPHFGIMKTDENGRITTFTEKPPLDKLEGWDSEVGEDMKREGRIYLASMGIYIFNRKFLFDILKEHKDAADFGKEVIPLSIEEYKVASYQYEGYWTDIGTIPSFFEANLELTDEIPKFNLFDNDRTIFSRARMLPPSKISNTALDRTVIADGCIIHASHIDRSVIGIRTRIGKGTNVLNSYVMGNDFYQTLDELNDAISKGIPPLGIGERCYINNAIIDKNCRIGNDVRINGRPDLEEGDHGLYTVTEGIVVVKKGSIVPHGFVV